MAEPAFQYLCVIRWGDCDPAGIMYYPRYFDLFHQAMEAWFNDALGLPYVEVIQGRKTGFPAVHTQADFSAPSAFGDAVTVELRVAKLGRSSIEFAYRVTARDAPADLRATGSTTCVAMDLDPASATFRRALPIADDLRARIDGFRAGS